MFTQVLMNLFNRVGQIFYGFEKTKFEKQRRLGKPRTPHNKYLCQACLEGICLSRRRACAAAGQQIPVCPVEELTKANNEEEEHDKQSLTQENENPISESESELVQQNNKTEPKIKLEDEDEGDYSEDSGIVENDADRIGEEPISKPEVALANNESEEETTQELC